MSETEIKELAKKVYAAMILTNTDIQSMEAILSVFLKDRDKKSIGQMDIQDGKEVMDLIEKIKKKVDDILEES